MYTLLGNIIDKVPLGNHPDRIQLGECKIGSEGSLIRVGIIMLEMQGDEMTSAGLQSRWARNHVSSMAPHGNMVSRA